MRAEATAKAEGATGTALHVSGNRDSQTSYENYTLPPDEPQWHIEVKQRPEGTRGFTPLEKRWVVERTNAWNGRCRRNSKDYERRPESSAAMIRISNIHLMLRKLSPVPHPAFHYRAAA